MGYDSSFPARTIRKHKVMASKVLLAALVAVASAAGPPAPYAPQEAYPDLPPVYNYQYGVNDPEYSGAVFTHQENRADYNTAGEYRVNLPDGRVQIVTYTAGPEGYIADVKYEGEAVYAEVLPTNQLLHQLISLPQLHTSLPHFLLLRLSLPQLHTSQLLMLSLSQPTSLPLLLTSLPQFTTLPLSTTLPPLLPNTPQRSTDTPLCPLPQLLKLKKPL